MTEVLDSMSQISTLASTTLQYEVAMPDPTSHLFEITLHCSLGTDDTLDLKLPVWTPGSYLVREYAKHLQDFSAVDDQGARLPWQKISKNHWQIKTSGVQTVTLHYRIFAHELTVRTNHLDASHGYFNPGAMFSMFQDENKMRSQSRFISLIQLGRSQPH